MLLKSGVAHQRIEAFRFVNASDQPTNLKHAYYAEYALGVSKFAAERGEIFQYAVAGEPFQLELAKEVKKGDRIQSDSSGFGVKRERYRRTLAIAMEDGEQGDIIHVHLCCGEPWELEVRLAAIEDALEDQNHE